MNEKIADINITLRHLAIIEGVTFADITNVLTKDGDVIPDMFCKDGYHINQYGTTKIIKCWHNCMSILPTGNVEEGIHLSKPIPVHTREHQPKPIPVHTRIGAHKLLHGPSYSISKGKSIQNRHHQQPHRRNYEYVNSDQGKACFFCGEQNHMKDKCRYGQPLKCHQCGCLGHKRKFCSNMGLSVPSPDIFTKGRPTSARTPTHASPVQKAANWDFSAQPQQVVNNNNMMYQRDTSLTGHTTLQFPYVDHLPKHCHAAESRFPPPQIHSPLHDMHRIQQGTYNNWLPHQQLQPSYMSGPDWCAHAGMVQQNMHASRIP